jgi:serine protease inhibitor
LQEFSESPGNVFISPASIKTTLALILEGAKGISAEEIENALRVDDINDKEIREILARLLFDLNVRLRHLIFAKSHSP